MGRDIQKETHYILNSLLIIGLLSDGNQMSATEIAKYLKTFNKGEGVDPEYIRNDYINKHIKSWISNSDDKIKGGRKGYKLLYNIFSEDEKKDLILSLLILAINKDRTPHGLEELMSKEGEKAISIIAKLIIAKYVEDTKLKIQLDEQKFFEFKPSRIEFKDNSWQVLGKFNNEDKHCKISEILKAKLNLSN